MALCRSSCFLRTRRRIASFRLLSLQRATDARIFRALAEITREREMRRFGKETWVETMAHTATTVMLKRIAPSGFR
jgi:hypothetical protein